MNALSGRFGSLSLGQTRWFSFMASAVVMAPKGSWLQEECEKTLFRACHHYGVLPADAMSTVSPGLLPCEEDLPQEVA